jgi:hypothetical protein
MRCATPAVLCIAVVGFWATAGSAGAQQMLRSEIVLSGVERARTPLLAWSLGRAILVQDQVVRHFDHASASVRSIPAGLLRSLDVEGSVWTDGARRSLGGAATLAFGSAGGAAGSLTASRDPVWRASRGADPLRSARVLDLALLDRGLGASELRVRMLLPFRSASKAEMEGGGTLYGDGNRRFFLHGRAHRIVRESESLFLGLEPSLYVESFAGRTDGFLTPRGYVNAGVTAQVLGHLGPASLDLSVRPHAFRDHEGVGIGLAAKWTSSLAIGRASIRVSTEAFVQGRFHFAQVVVALTGPS